MARSARFDLAREARFRVTSSLFIIAGNRQDGHV